MLTFKTFILSILFLLAVALILYAGYTLLSLPQPGPETIKVKGHGWVLIESGRE